MDYRGMDYRKSAVTFLKSFMDAVGLERAHIMGNSMGGYFSTCFSLEYPDRVTNLILIGAPAGMNLWIPLMLRILGIKGINRFLLKYILKPSISGAKNIHKNLIVFDVEKLSNTYYEHSYYNQLLPGSLIAHTTLLESVLTLKGWRKELYLTPELNRLKMPVHFIWGDKDVFESPDSGIQKAASIENHTFSMVQDAGHCPWLDQPDQCAALILEQLKH
jgi:pimeloyl-ACP methyl ester carboxylesterase